MGVVYAKKKDYQKALKYWLKSKSVKADNPVLLAGLGLVYEKLNKTDKAIEEYKLCIQADPFNHAFISHSDDCLHLRERIKK